MALYEPGLGYYASGRIVVGRMPEGGSDFVTAPELSPLFGRALARQVEEALAASGSDEVWEFGAGSGALAAELLAGARPAHPPLLDRRAVGAAARAPARGDARVRRRRPLARRAARADERRRHRQRGARCDAGRPAALRRHGLVRARRRPRRGRARARLQRPADRAQAAERGGVAGRHDDRDPCPGRSLRRHAGGADGAGRGLLRRLRLSGERVLPPAALAGHPDVPPRASLRHRRARRRRHQGHHRPCRFHRRRPRRPGRRLRRRRLHLAGALPPQLRHRRADGAGVAARPRRGGDAPQRARDGRAVQGDRLHQGPARLRAAGLRRRRPAASACSRRP